VTAEQHAVRVYPHFGAIAALLKSPSKIVRWNAMRLVGLLAVVDAERKVDAVLDEYLGFIQGEDLISAANAIGGAGLIGAARPDLLGRIVPALIGVERASYATPECRNVAIGHALKTLRTLGPNVCRRPDVARFVERQTVNTRPGVARRAREMLADATREQRVRMRRERIKD